MVVRRAWWAIGGAVCLVLSLMALASFASRSGDDVRDRLRRFVAAVDERAPGSRQRDAVWGETTEGSAFDLYAQGMTAMRPLPTGFGWNGKKQVAQIGGEAVDAQRLAELRRQWAPALALFAAGAHRRDATPGGRLPSWPKHPPFAIGWMVEAEFESRCAEGDAPGAVRLWLDWLTFATDLLQDSVDVGETSMAIRFVALWSDARLATLPAAELALLGVGLAALDAHIPTRVDHEVPIANQVRGLLDGSVLRARGSGWTVRERARAWSSGFDVERRYLEELDELRQLAAVLTPPSADGAGRQEQWRVFRTAPHRSWSYLASQARIQMVSVECNQLEALASLRLLRLAVAVHCGEVPPGLADPFGTGPLQRRDLPDAVVFASEGTFRARERTVQRR